MNTLIGTRFVLISEEENPPIVRLVRTKNDNTFVVMDEDTKETKKVTKQDLIKKYIKLLPDGFVSISIVQNENAGSDVLIYLNRRIDIDKGITEPFVICRQNCMNPFTMTNTPDKHTVGVSISRATCPTGVSFKSFLLCSSVSSTTMINVYKDDTIDSILSMVSCYKYDSVIANTSKDIVNPETYIGFQTNLRDLLNANNFIYDFNLAFDIMTLDGFAIESIEDKDTCSYTAESYNAIIDKLGPLVADAIQSCILIPYDIRINTNDIKRKFYIVRDSLQKVYLFAYEIDESKIKVPKEKLGDVIRKFDKLNGV